MTTYGFHASHEQFAPGELLDLVRAAERAGFASGMCSDHFAPWSARQGHSGHAWAWLGSALALTGFPMGVVTAPGQRYHPAVHAQAVATLAGMYPGRLWVALGTGQNLNEHITGDVWPEKATRMRRLEECVELYRALFAGKTVSCEGLIRVDRARLWSRPETPPALLAAAVTPDTARWAAGWADGLITVNQRDETHAKTLEAYRSAGGRGPALLQAHVCWARDEERALAAAHDQWREAIFGSGLGWEIPLPEQFEEAARFVRPEHVAESVHVSADPAEHARWLAEQGGMGFDQVMVHQVGRDQREFIDTFARDVLPRLTG